MKILLTGGTGFIGGAVLDQLLRSGHDVTALVRNNTAAATVTRHGAVPLLGDLTDVGWLSDHLTNFGAAIHTAAPGDSSAAEFDGSVAKAVTAAFAGTDRPYLHTGGIWVYGNGSDITEQSPFAPPALTAWRPDVENDLLTAGLAVTVIVPGIVYGHGRGIPGLIAGAPRSNAGALVLIGDGEQHWTSVHADDLAALYVRVLELGSGLGHVIGVNGEDPTVHQLGLAAAGPDGVQPESTEASRARIGTAFTDALLLDQQATGAKARSLGWKPSQPSLVEELRRGSYSR